MQAIHEALLRGHGIFPLLDEHVFLGLYGFRERATLLDGPGEGQPHHIGIAGYPQIRDCTLGVIVCVYFLQQAAIQEPLRAGNRATTWGLPDAEDPCGPVLAGIACHCHPLDRPMLVLRDGLDEAIHRTLELRVLLLQQLDHRRCLYVFQPGLVVRIDRARHAADALVMEAGCLPVHLYSASGDALTLGRAFLDLRDFLPVADVELPAPVPPDMGHDAVLNANQVLDYAFHELH